MILTLTRWSTGKDGTFGTLDGIPGFNTPLATCERPVDKNINGIACIPTPKTTYPCDYDISPRLTAKAGHPVKKYHVRNVPGNPGILFHGGNFDDQSLGCILLGKQMSIDQATGEKMIIHSQEAVKEFETAMGGKPFDLAIVWGDPALDPHAVEAV